MWKPVAVVAALGLSSGLGAQDSVHFPPADAIAIRVMSDVPAALLTKGFLGRTVVGATGSFTLGEFDDGAGAPLHHHEREQVNVGIDGVMEMALGTHTEPLPVGAAVITPANVQHSIRNRSGGKLISLEFHTIRRPDLVPPRPRPVVPYPVSPEPVDITDDSRLVAQLANTTDTAGGARTIQGKTCTLTWRRVVPTAGPTATDLTPTPGSVETFVYVVSGDGELTAARATSRVNPGTLILIPAGHQGVLLRASRTMALVEFRPALH
jgi:mannose-6-phosphate isomerase-like protein (cupin superfamily)